MENFELVYLYQLIIICLLVIILKLLHIWKREHADMMSIMNHRLTQIKEKIE